MNKSISLEIQTAEKQIKGAWIAAFISAGVTLLFALLSIGGSIFDAILVAGLGFGIMKKSRVCAVIIFVYFLASKIYIWSLAGNVNGWWMALLFLYYFGAGIQGTFTYHRLTKLKEAESYPPNLDEVSKQPTEHGSTATKFCPDCGEKNDTKAKYCVSCGKKFILS